MSSNPVTSRHFFCCAAALASCFAFEAHAGDFIFGEDFDVTPSCTGITPPAIVIATSPIERNSTLGTQNRYLIHIRSCGYTGTVTLTDDDVPVTWGALIDPATPTIQSGKAINALLSIAVPTEGEAIGASISLNASTNAMTTHGQVNLTIANEWIYTFVDGTGSGDHHFPPTLRLKLGTKVRFIDQDTVTAHRVHANGITGSGFEHESSDLHAGGEYDQTPLIMDTYVLLCHDHPNDPQTVVVIE
jgi:plastocyanin